MDLTVQIEDTLAEELRQEAAAERVSPEELAHRLVRDAFQQRVARRRWPAQNRRRVELIAQKMHGPLPASEQEELDRLQLLAHQRAASFDEELRQGLEAFRLAVEQLPEESTP
jgi:hypothetical protein